MGTSTHTNSYRKIISSTAVFGGAQVVGVLINLIRGKLVALILHSAGMGIMTLLTNAANTIQQFALLGMNVSAVRNISQVKEEGAEQVLTFTIRIVRSLFLLAALFGLVLMIIASPLISQTSFGSLDYLPILLLLSLSIFLSILGSGEMTIMQGLRQYKQLAFCSIVPPLCGLFVSVPIYYFWGIEGIVPAMIVSGAVYYLTLRHFSFRKKKTTATQVPLSLRTIWKYGHDIIQMGFVMTFGTIVGTLTTYCLIAFISNRGSVSDVGFYQAANMITVQLVSMIFTAMATDFYPRLSACYQKEGSDANLLVNQQTEVVLLGITPMALLLILTAPLLINVLLTSEFQPIRQLVYYIALANIFKALCFPMDYIAYAKGDKQYIFWIETIWGNAKTFTVMAGCYLMFGLEGLGYGALASAVIDVVVSVILTRIRYGFKHSGSVVQLLAVMLVMASLCFVATTIETTWLSYTIMASTTLCCILFSTYQLNKRVHFKEILQRHSRKA